ncbi:MAG: hypothetical protein A2161_06640 [Candidatus Schekmanbacteria bacterium RBG_13_48_7]|uniref:Uncharacterized protein n=1 Tax=Candidatus Schekmanbacteria bacterium RBG_13_48_7 TaxID=1817878 RepID=A0A1F7RTV8_9BACT|nr:MAG: hypothetical protein A2161_06640 [Candidatus Schekmanbacteria bacterium RBG_13_48_7]
MSNKDLYQVAGKWDLVRESQSSGELTIYQENPWVVENNGSQDRDADFETETQIIHFTLDGYNYIGLHTNKSLDKTPTRFLAGNWKYGTNRGTWYAPYLGPLNKK